ncbi:MAG: hypothetical protein LAP40_01345 [Acidobacteriia bacterium]|nr:hypothetical protein [Terriglobia bacterium]
MADQQKAEKKTRDKETPTKKVKPSEPKAGEPAAEVVSPPAAPASVAPRQKSAKIPKLTPKNKHRLPRRLKKAQRKGAAAQQLK